MAKEMSFWDHLEVLRRMLFRTAIVLVGAMVVVFLNKSLVFDVIIFGPRTSDFILYRWMCQLGDYLRWEGLCPEAFSIPLININMAAQFFTHISTSFWLGLVFAFPYVIWELWKFVAPALYDHEKRSVRYAFAFSSVLFFIGVTVGYVFIFPLSIRFLGLYQVSEIVPNEISLNSYIGMFVTLILTMGLVFEMPVLAHVLSRFGIITRRFLRKYRRHAVILVLVLSAVITPSPDAFTMIMVAVPLYLLYEFSILVCKKV
ncbi:MAG: twin-arginine translocase subunit TatC [Prevotellaceae bacterium]|jgi:sec-independent protein translocase protein TatC|nr:twin-arginine translocase subunit TatC [Prevotellaceae bacterium]